MRLSLISGISEKKLVCIYTVCRSEILGVNQGLRADPPKSPYPSGRLCAYAQATPTPIKRGTLNFPPFLRGVGGIEVSDFRCVSPNTDKHRWVLLRLCHQT